MVGSDIWPVRAIVGNIFVYGKDFGNGSRHSKSNRWVGLLWTLGGRTWTVTVFAFRDSLLIDWTAEFW